MSTNELKTRIKHAYKTESEWSNSNPVLLKGEVAYSSDKNNKYKVGDGTHKWSELSYAKADLSKSDVTTALGYTPPTTNTTYSTGTASTSGLTKLYTSTGTATDGTMTQAALKTALDGKSGTTHTHNYAGSSSAGGSANSANKLSTARTIGLGTGATGTATSFDGSANITIPVTGVKEAYLSWGGKNFAASYGCIDAAMIPALGANRFAFMPAEAIEVQYSTNGGSTWSAYGTNDDNKINLFNGNNATYYIGCNSASKIDKTNYQLRITITTDTAKVYTVLNKFMIYCSTSGSTGSWCSIDAKTKANVDSGTDTWVNFANKVSIEGWSGYNIINTSGITTYGNSSYQYQKLRFTFGVASHASTVAYNGLQILGIMAFGGVGWNIPSTMAKNGHMYTYDANKNVSFPAQVTATQFNGKATALTSDAGSATQPVYFSGGKPVATTYTLGKSVPSNAVFTDTNTWRGIQNNLTSDSTTDSLSAAQGKALKALVDSKTSNTGTITGITMNGSSKGTSGVVNLGTVLTGGSQTTTSTVDGGSNVYTFSDKSTITVKNGSKGSAGTNGTSAAWFTGTAVTGTSTSATAFTVSGSKAGDMYLNTSTYNVYRASAANSWIYVCNIKGATGAKGSDGTNGTNGTNGVTPTIKAAAGTNIGTVGTPTVTASTSGTTTTFTFNNLKGEKGDKGADGVNATTTAVATTSANGLMSKDMVTKLNGIATGANAYTHPTSSGNKHIPSGGSSGQILRWSADGTAVWGSDNNTDTKVTNTLATTTKAYVTGTTSASTNTGTQVFDTGVYLDTTAGRLHMNEAQIGKNNDILVVENKITCGGNKPIRINDTETDNNEGKHIVIGDPGALFKGNICCANGRGVYGRRKDNDDWNAMAIIDENNNSLFGNGGYDSEFGNTYYSGNHVYLRSKNEINITSPTAGLTNRAYGVNNVLWSGEVYPSASDSLTFSEAVSAQPNGIIIMFQWYDRTNWKAADSDIYTFFVPKYAIVNHPGGYGFSGIDYGGSYAFSKYFYIKDTGITGADLNSTSSQTSSCGIKTVNWNFVLTKVIGI